MPELPEVETTLRGILPFAEGVKISKAKVRKAQLRQLVNHDFNSRIKKQTIVKIYRRAKYLILQLNDGAILIHLGMSGTLLCSNEDQEIKKHDHIDIILENGYILRYNDPRRFGLVKWYPDPIDKITLLAKLGPEPLTDDFNPNYLFEKLKNRHLSIKQAIMDNKIVVGVGNIYACESLFLAKINPKTKSAEISLKNCKKLVKCIKQVLADAILQGGTTLKDFYGSDGKPGYFKQSLHVYGRKLETCLKCGTPIESIVQGQRSTFYCPHCQH